MCGSNRWSAAKSCCGKVFNAEFPDVKSLWRLCFWELRCFKSELALRRTTKTPGPGRERPWRGERARGVERWQSEAPAGGAAALRRPVQVRRVHQRASSGRTERFAKVGMGAERPCLLAHLVRHRCLPVSGQRTPRTTSRVQDAQPPTSRTVDRKASLQTERDARGLPHSSSSSHEMDFAQRKGSQGVHANSVPRTRVRDNGLRFGPGLQAPRRVSRAATGWLAA